MFLASFTPQQLGSQPGIHATTHQASHRHFPDTMGLAEMATSCAHWPTWLTAWDCPPMKDKWQYRPFILQRKIFKFGKCVYLMNDDFGSLYSILVLLSLVWSFRICFWLLVEFA